MKNYRLTIFSQPNCNPCIKLKDHLKTLDEGQRLELEIAAFKDSDGERTADAKQAGVTLTPTLVVSVPSMTCCMENGEEYCTVHYVPVESVVGCKEIIRQLPDLLAAYTYAISE